jgi:glucose/mannose transport system substrate-binding protein
MNRFNRKALVGLLAATTAVTMTACGGSSSGSPGGSSSGGESAKPGALEVFSWWTSGSEDAALKALIAGYVSAVPGAKVTNGAVSGGGGSNAQAVLQTRLQGNNAPDTWQTHPGEAIKQYTDGNMVADLSSVYTKDDLAASMPKALLDGVSKDGKPYGVSTGAHRGNVLWFNKALLKKAGVQDPVAGYTTDAFLADLAKLKSAGVTPLCLGGKDTFAVVELFENTLLGSIGPDGWNSLTTGKTTWDDPKVKTAATQFGKMLPYTDPDAGALTWDQATKKLADGKCAFESMGDWAYGELNKDGAKEGTTFGYVPHPGTDGSFVAVVDTFVVAANAKHPASGKEWASVLASKDVQLAFNKAKGSVPIRNDVDISSFPPYQQAAAKSFRADQIVQSIVHGEAMNPQFQQSLFDAITQFVQGKDVNALIQALTSAASS